MEQRLLSLLQSPLNPNQLKQLHALIVTSQPSIFPLFLKLETAPATTHNVRQVFDVIPQPDPLFCNSIISIFSKLSLHQDAINVFFSAHRKGTELLFFTVPSILKSCASSVAAVEGKQVHALSLVRGFCSNVYIQTALIDFYSKNGDMDAAEKVFGEISVKDPVPCNCLISGYSKSGNVQAARRVFEMMLVRTVASWNSMISCYAHVGDPVEGLRLFERMRNEKEKPNEMTLVTVLSICAKLGDLSTGLKVKEMVDAHDLRTNLIVRTAVLEMYVKCGAVDEARKVFDEMCQRDVVAWSAMIAGYAQNGRSIDALELFENMRLVNVEPNEVTLVSVLSACAQLGSVEVGEQVGKYIESQGFASGVYVGSALLDMYAKCGNIKRARAVFDNMHHKDVVSWNSMIGGLAFNGLADDAIELYKKMIREQFKPNDVTFVGLLSACVHGGLVAAGIQFFDRMQKEHNVVPKVEHCACMVDLYCRSGRLEEAYKFISDMEVEPNVVIWGTLLSACRVHSNVELAKSSMEKLLVLEPDNSANYVLLSSIYADAGRWEEARKMRNLMRRKDVQKVAGYSWIELDDKVHKFLVGDTFHPRCDDIYDVVDGLSLQLKWVDKNTDYNQEVSEPF
ncbi:putative tetratricopeptide-like helical domain superfamily [Dioscorea sansibarensis]